MEKVSLIIGASGDIGLAIAKRLAQDGHLLILHYYKNQESIDHLVHELPENNMIMTIQADLTCKEGLEQLLDQLPEYINQVVFASGTTYYGLIQDMHDRDMERMLHLHLKAPWKITQQLIPSMLKSQYGNIVLITSIWGDVGASCEVAYSTVKGGQTSFIKALAKELGPSGILVNGVSPGFIDTKMNNHLSETEQKMITEDIPLQRKGKPMDVANTVSFLLSEKSSYIHGEIIRVNGAW